MPLPGRNDPCSCGSGRKYKHCCGAIPAAAPRSCGSCTACCDGWLRIRIDDQDVYPGRPCPYSTGHSCSNYQNRPEYPCRHFVCGWLQPGSPLPDSYRPDRIGLIFVIERWRGRLMYRVVPAGRDPTPQMITWIKSVSEAKRVPVVWRAGELWYAHGPPEFQREMLQSRASDAVRD